jgi:hypothetical protein
MNDWMYLLFCYVVGVLIGCVVHKIWRAFQGALQDIDPDTIKVMLGVPVHAAQTWCQGCDLLVHGDWMKFTDDGLYRCNQCRGRTPQFVMDLSSPEDVEAGREVLAVHHNDGRTQIMTYQNPWWLAS